MSVEQQIPGRDNPSDDSEVWTLRLYVAGNSAKSVAAARNLHRLCETYLPGRYTIEQIDLLQQPERAQRDQILAIPTIVRSNPGPIKKLIGDLSNTERALETLEIGVAGRLL